MTSRLYYSDSYLMAFDATLVERSDDGRRVVLDRTAFYPSSGGQPFDTGMLGGAPVIDVVDEGDRIAHLLGTPVEKTAPGEPIRGEVDWKRRFDHMQQHTGQHLLSAVFAELFGHETVSVHFGADSSSLDLDVGSISAERAIQAERRANEIVWENRVVSVSFEDAATATGLRKTPTREGTLRVVTIDRLDRSACGGTHVRATGEIGPILLRALDRVRKQARVEFLCGARAVRRSRADFEALSRIAHGLSASIDEAAALVAAQSAQLRDAENLRKRLESELAGYQARTLYDATPPAGRARLALVSRDGGTLDDLRPLAHAFSTMPGAVFVGTITSPPTVLVAASDDSGLDAGATLKRALGAVGGRGGGSSRIAQGTVPQPDALDTVVRAVRDAAAGGDV